MKGKLYTSYFSKIKQGIGLKVSVARFDPKWLQEDMYDGNIKSLAPSESLLKEYKKGNMDWSNYVESYKDTLFSRGTLGLKGLQNILDKGQDVTIYCYEKPTDNCHRHILGKIFKNLGYEVEEI